MLVKFRVKNFRSIKEEVVLDMTASSDDTRKDLATFERGDVSLLKAVAIYGANASGKSNVLMAFDSFKLILMSSLNYPNNQGPIQQLFYKLDRHYKDQPTEFEITFVMDDEVYIYGFHFDQSGFVKEYLEREKGKVEFFLREGQEFKISNERFFKESTKDLQEQTHQKSLHLSLLNQRNGEIAKKVFASIFKMNFINCISQREIGNNITIGYSIQNATKRKNIVDFMKGVDKSIFEFNISQDKKHISELPNVPKEVVDIASKQNGGMVNINELFVERKNKDGEIVKFDFISEESEGTKQAFAMAGPIYDTLGSGGVLFLDEFTATLHPMLARYIVEIFNSKMKNPLNAQIIFATHDTTILDKDIMRRDQIYFVNKIKEGHTELFSLADISERKEGINFAKRYLEGRYDAVPYIKELDELIKEKENN